MELGWWNSWAGSRMTAIGTPSMIMMFRMTTVFSRIIALGIWWISKDEQKRSERIEYKSKSENSKAVRSHQMTA
jgi:hypothetical protein